jgi:hypothetical protein
VHDVSQKANTKTLEGLQKNLMTSVNHISVGLPEMLVRLRFFVGEDSHLCFLAVSRDRSVFF